MYIITFITVCLVADRLFCCKFFAVYNDMISWNMAVDIACRTAFTQRWLSRL